MAEDEIVELLWKNGQLVRQRQTPRPTSDEPSPPPILHGSGSGGGGIENAPLPQTPLPLQPPDQNLFIQEDEMASWLHHPFVEDYFPSDLLESIPASSVSMPPPPPPRPTTSQTIRPNFMNFSRIIGRAAPSMPVARTSTQVDSSTTQSSLATESYLTPATENPWRSQGFLIPGFKREGKAVAVEIAGNPKAETEPIQMQPPATPSSSATESCLTPATESPWTAHGFRIPGNRKGKAVAVEIAGTPKAEPIQILPPPTETEFADDRKRKAKVETIEEIEKKKEARGSTSKKRSRAAEMHNLAERRRRERINARMKALQQILPRCTKPDKVSMLTEAVDFVKLLQQQIQMMSTGSGSLPMTYPPNIQQRFMPQMGMGMNRPPLIPFPRQPHHIGGVGPSPSYPPPRYPLPNIQTSDPSRVHLPPTQQLNPMLNRPHQFMDYTNPYSQFVGPHHQMLPPPPPLQNQTSQMSFSQASSSKQSEDQKNQPPG